MTLEEIYESAGQAAGLEVWRIEKFDMGPVDNKFHGTFYTGDCYIVLYTWFEKDEETGVEKKYQNLHFWIGSAATQDEYGSAAIISTQLDTALGDLPVQFRETEGHESLSFKKLFKKRGGIVYKEGGFASGFKHAITNQDDENRMLQVKGKRKNITAKEVKFSWESVHNDDVYLFEIGSDIYRWKGPDANMFEWMQSNILANSIRDDEQGGRGKITVVDGNDFPAAITDLLGAAPEEFEANPVSDDSSEKHAKLYKVSMDTGDMEVTLVHDDTKKPHKSIMEDDDCYILDTGDHGIYVWRGSTALLSEKQQAMKSADKFIEDNGLSVLTTSVSIQNAGRETEMFKLYFKGF